MQLRPYQTESIERVYRHLRDKDTNPCIVLPTAGGKSYCIAQIIKDTITRWNGRACVLAHRKELLEQNARHIATLLDDTIPIGIYSAGLGEKNHNAPVVVAGIQSIFRKACEVGRFDLILIDEAHHIPPDGEGMYRQFLEEAKVVNPRVRLIGFTATPYRMSTGMICAEENLLNEICHEVSIRQLINEGYLCELVSRSGKPESIADTSHVHCRGGEFISGELEDAMANQDVVRSAVREILHHTANRNKCLIFTCGVEHGQMVQNEFFRVGERCEFITGETPAMLRKFALETFKDLGSGLKYLVNINVLGEGFDSPILDSTVLLRATKSPGCYYQMVGRTFRPHPSKENSLVLDFGENIMRHGPVDAIRPTATNGGGEAPMKVCPQCRAVVYAGMRSCDQCAYEFPFEDQAARHTRQASEEGILSDQITRAWHSVESVSYSEHHKRGADEDHPRTLRVDYRINFSDWISEWICIEHPPGGFPREKAERWWFRRSGMDFPDSAAKAAEIGSGRLLREPTHILVKETAGSRWPEVCGARFSDDEYVPPKVEVNEIKEEDIPF